ncbi:CHASE domain-containing protein [Duganella sp. BJB1802]|uniref:CHASE domain-containing protein n=1 Tax=Duganella sp. BJB1802 TaxID=2744575 RepID=UPI0015942210|nr:CHASE domain-containing protein [Duganella sp. BJB1802]NVD74897.1 CHASE domain-containing protein [Duganella sp. BJB1802]
MRSRGYLAFIVGICVTAATCGFVAMTQRQQVQANFQRDVDKVAHDTEVRLQTYFDVLLAIKGMYALEQDIDRLRFHRFVAELKLDRRYPGFQAIQFVRAVPQARLAPFVAAVKGDTSIEAGGYPGFLVHPANLRDPHFIIEYTEPLKGNENAFGLDLSALPPHLKALELGRDTGEIVATERITLVQDATGEPGFVARAPVYRGGPPQRTVEQRRDALVGFVAIVFRVGTLMREVIDAPLLEHLHVRIDDDGYFDAKAAPASSADTLLYNSAGTSGMRPPRGEPLDGLVSQKALMVGQRRWLMRFEGYGGGRYGRSPLPVLLIGVAGFIISALIAALLVSTRRVVDAKHGLEYSLAELERQKANVEQARSDLAVVVETLKQAQTNLLTSEKMASLGALVAGVAHELNTPIGNSLLTASALSDMVRDFERRLVAEGGLKRSVLEAHLHDARKACDIMNSSLTRAADLITSFKQVAVDQASGQRRRFQLDEVVHDTLATYAAQLRRNGCEVRVDVPPGLEFDSYPGSLSQVLSNLIGNALLHGFDGRGHGAIAVEARREGADTVKLTFSDNGAGMTAGTLHKVFDPFFTTKLGQGGSGLGMNIVYNIVTGVLRGTIRVDSSPGAGTTVTLMLPMRAPQEAPPESQEA